MVSYFNVFETPVLIEQGTGNWSFIVSTLKPLQINISTCRFTCQARWLAKCFAKKRHQVDPKINILLLYIGNILIPVYKYQIKFRRQISLRHMQQRIGTKTQIIVPVAAISIAFIMGPLLTINSGTPGNKDNVLADSCIFSNQFSPERLVTINYRAQLTIQSKIQQ